MEGEARAGLSRFGRRHASSDAHGSPTRAGSFRARSSQSLAPRWNGLAVSTAYSSTFASTVTYGCSSSSSSSSASATFETSSRIVVRTAEG